ncbi:hypothetical protein LCGC14_2450830, partial [marine sediment metagenome]
MHSADPPPVVQISICSTVRVSVADQDRDLSTGG